ncbi:MAG: chemotaxis protein CheW [Halothiobacillaceae bacterium]|nr:chemotaxis protein CheW [Halothiobacillaceae bacterium]MDY0050678.1 chemotaxis protein CheW [Halothiobacillaceae bacterium]
MLQSGGTTSQWVTFVVEDESYAINVLKVQEVLRNAEITPVPGAPDSVLGIINLRGNVVTVVDARLFFGLPERRVDDSSRIIIVELGQQQVAGVVVDSVAEVIELSQEEIDMAPSVSSDESSRHIEGVVSRPDKLVILVNLDGVLHVAKGRR